jgi:hypothetical protein
MNDEAARRPPAIPAAKKVAEDDSTHVRGDELAARIVAAREALMSGDVDEGLAMMWDIEAAVAPAAVRARCESCGASFEWPGLRDAHLARGCDRRAA